MSGQFSQSRFWHTCSGLRFFASRAIDPQLRDASVLVLCLLKGPSEFVVDFVKNRGLLFDACLLVTCCVTDE